MLKAEHERYGKRVKTLGIKQQWLPEAASILVRGMVCLERRTDIASQATSIIVS